MNSNPMNSTMRSTNATLDVSMEPVSMPRRVLNALTSPHGMAVIFALFAVYGIWLYFTFGAPRADGSLDALLIAGLVTQFIGLLGVLVMLRAIRDGRLLETFFVVFFVWPLNIIAMQAAMHASSGTPLTLEMLTRSSILFYASFPSSHIWLILGAGVIAFGVVLVIDAKRQRARRAG